MSDLNVDYQRHKDFAEELIFKWEKNEKRLTQESLSDDLELLLNSTLHFYEILYATKYAIWLFKRYRQWPGDLPQEELASIILDLLPKLDKIDNDAAQMWKKLSLRIEKRLTKKEWKGYYAHLHNNFGPGKYKVAL